MTKFLLNAKINKLLITMIIITSVFSLILFLFLAE